MVGWDRDADRASNDADVFSIPRGWLEHKVGREFGTDFCSLRREGTLRPDTDHELNLVRKRERLFEYQVSIPFSASVAEHRRNASLDFKLIFDGSELNGGRRAKT